MALDLLATKIKQISKQKDVILEIAQIMLDYQQSNAEELVEFWMQEFAGFQDEG
jgi:hypothetical protein